MSLHRLSNASVLLALAMAPVWGQSRAALTSSQADTSGGLLGEVRNTAGVAQMGASVFLFDKYDNLLQKAISTEKGQFAFAGLTPDLYTVRVSLASFFPAVRRNILVAAGSERLLQVSLAAVLSSIDIAPGVPGKATLMSDEWKWVLRSSQATRPVLRFLPIDPVPTKESASLFSETTGVVRLSGGDSNPWNSSLQQDMGTAFALETSMSGGSKVRVSGSFGYGAATGLPSAGLRTTYSRERAGAPGPQISLTARQAFFPAAIGGSPQNAPAMRTASLSTFDSMEIMDGLKLEYGFSMDSVMLYGRMNYFSPFARATYTLSEGGVLKAAFSNGFAPTELLARRAEGSADFSNDLAALSIGPRISRRDDHAAVERNKSYEVAYEVVDGTRSFSVMAFRDQVSDAVFLMSGDISLAGAANLLPDLNTRGTVFNAGNFQRSGISARLSESLTDRIDVSVDGGYAGALTAPQGLEGPLRSQIAQTMRPWVTARMDGRVPRMGTHLAASYGWTDFRTLMPVHQSLTGRTGQQIGWNASVRQPLPGMFGVRMELTADLRNLLAQGYLGMSGSDGRRAVLTNTPRQVRGGVSFIF